MPKFDSKAENVSFQTIEGDYPFEVVAVDNSISTGAKTRGSDVRDVKLKFYSDATFTKPLAQWTEDFINAENCLWKWSVFAKCIGLELADGQDFDIDASCIGRRGWATCKPQADRNDATKKYNRVAVFLVNKGQIPRNTQVAQQGTGEDCPF